MRVLIVGLPLFAERLQKDLERFDPSNKYYCLNTYYSKKDRIKALFLIPTVDVVYSINGTLGTSRVFNLALRLNKRVMMTWVGTDVTKAKKQQKINQLFKNEACHYCEVAWIQQELKQDLDIDAKILNFFNFSESKAMKMPEGDRLKVLSYISSGREKYYGWDEVITAAKSHPEVDFTFVGTEGIEEWPENVKCLGWVDNMAELFDQHHCTIRFVEHDGLSGFVLESLYRGKQVIYSEPLDHCLHVKNVEEISAAIDDLKSKLQKGESLLNTEGNNFVDQNFNTEKILGDLIKEMKK